MKSPIKVNENNVKRLCKEYGVCQTKYISQQVINDYSISCKELCDKIKETSKETGIDIKSLRLEVNIYCDFQEDDHYEGLSITGYKNRTFKEIEKDVRSIAKMREQRKKRQAENKKKARDQERKLYERLHRKYGKKRANKKQ